MIRSDVTVIPDEEECLVGRFEDRVITRSHLLEILETQTTCAWFPSERDYKELKRVETTQHFNESAPFLKKQGFKAVMVENAPSF